MSLSPTEKQIHKSFVQWLYLQDRLGKIPWLWFHVPNEGNRTKHEKLLRYKLGLRAGIADLIFVGRKSFMVEIKTQTGRQSPAQKLIMAECFKKGVNYYVVRSFDDFREVLNKEYSFLNILKFYFKDIKLKFDF